MLVYCGFIGNPDSLIVVQAADLCTHRALTSSPPAPLLSGCLYPLENFVQLNCLLSIALSPPSICGGWRYWVMLGLIWPKFWPNLHNFPLARLAGRDNRPLLHFSVSLSRNHAEPAYGHLYRNANMRLWHVFTSQCLILPRYVYLFWAVLWWSVIAIPSHAEASSELCGRGVRVSPGRHRAQLSSTLWHLTAEMWVGAILNIYVFLGAIREIIWRCAACFPNLDNSKRWSRRGRTLINIFVHYAVLLCSFRLMIEYFTPHMAWLVTWTSQV